MLKITHPNFDKLKNLLLRQQKKVEEDIKNLEKGDPVMDQTVESSEPGTDSWMADVHSRVVALKASLKQMLEKTRYALNKLKKGEYGKCEKCGQYLEWERLEAIPTATLCISCSKKKK